MCNSILGKIKKEHKMDFITRIVVSFHIFLIVLIGTVLVFFLFIYFPFNGDDIQVVRIA